MRLFHLSDLHIGLKLLNWDMREDQEYIFGQIAALAAEKRPDAIVIAGDIYDKSAPSAEAVEVFDRFLPDWTVFGVCWRESVCIRSGNRLCRMENLWRRSYCGMHTEK